ncbi:MAG: polysaccharide biosynthesis tyrosine autokinase [Alphaproteobacteria bacterium]|nr:polysaccharide biosynthesis tyrosine autokinase [Alphaproteobacteria bacterium]
MFDQVTDEQDWITFSGLIRVVKVHWRTILTVTGVIAALAMLVASLLTPLYTATALVMVDEQQAHVLDNHADPSVLSDIPSDPSSIASQVQVLQSQALAGQIVDKLKLKEDPEFNGSQTDPITWLTDAIGNVADSIVSLFSPSQPQAAEISPTDRMRQHVINTVLRRLDVQSVGLSTVIQVTFKSSSPTKSAQIANTFASTFVNDQSKAKTDASEGASKWLATRVSQLAHQTSAADAAVLQYKMEHGLVDTSTGTPLTDQQLSDLTSQLVTAEGNLAEAEAKNAHVLQLIASGHSADVTEVIDSPLITQLRGQESQLIQQRADLSSRYGPLHPKMQDVNAQLSELKGKISEEVNRIAGTVSNDVSVASARVSALKSDMAKLSSTTNVQNEVRVKLGELQANATAAHALYQAYLDRYMQTQQSANFDIPAVHIASAATVPLSPSFPKKILIIGASIPAGLLFGLLVALVLDRMCNGFRSVNELEVASGLPVLATVPEVAAEGTSLRDVSMEVVARPHSQFSESIRGLEIGLFPHDEPSSGSKIVLVTSALPGEGKTTIAVNLARRLALAGHKTVIVDADLRRPRVANALGVRQPKRLITDCLAKRCTVEDALVPDPCSPLMALVAAPATDPARIVGSQGMAQLAEKLRQEADYIIFDSAPVLAVHDAKVLAKVCDGVFIVVRWQSTPREAVLMTIKSLRSLGVQLLGSALARANADQYQYYAYGYTGAPALASYYER